MPQERLSREEFHVKLAETDPEQLKKVLWTLYWRGAAPLRARIEALIDPPEEAQPTRVVSAPSDPKIVLAEVRQFAALARAGAYLAGDRRVSPKERTRWRHTFRRLAADSLDALRGGDFATVSEALTVLVDLACETRGLDYFRSDDPLEAARFVVSDAVTALWSRIREERGGTEFSERVAADLLRWESRYGWTRRGEGWTSAHEMSLASALSRLLVAPEQWSEVAECYLLALDRVATSTVDRRQRADDLGEWHALLVARLVGSEHEGLLDRLVEHPALGGPELTFLQARLARERGQQEEAAALIARCLKTLPGHPEFRTFAAELGPRT